ncbi:PAS domain-containing sensor histidine kinase [Rhodocytophaga aerolata]|uniref:histidine kinase n=1 Tax=Rhodocytophaga aerolata TaxID=455078 RepID=A0ABT8R441_9BACT|nr:PAS domain-containing sensor histidine kinase [Rhodocytophaga aerolata]MDO1446853.1 PAS domain-containing sensor histidine kinase [Rhodocytophaga aerolata]
MEILYSGLLDETLHYIQPGGGATSIRQVSEQELSSPSFLLDKAGIVIIGERVSNPIQLAQVIYSKDNAVSILLISDPVNHRKIKQALQFTPISGSTIHSISNEGRQGMALVLENQMARTEQRRSYKKMKSLVGSLTFPVPQSFDRLKQQYIDKVFEEAPVGIILLNESGTIQAFNPYAAQLIAKTEREVLGLRLEELFPEKNKQQIKSFVTNAEAATSKLVLEKESNDASQYVEITLASLKRGHALTYKTVLLSDVSHQILSKKAIEESARKVELILESLPQIAWTANGKGENTYLNQQWYAYTNSYSQDRAGFSLKAFLHTDDLQATLGIWSASLQQGVPFEVEHRIRRGQDGMYRWMLSRALPLTDEKGDITFWVGTTTDIHDLRLAQQELQKLNEQLAASNEELSAANEEVLANNEELASANESLRQVNADLDNFIYTASHDLKAPIANIDGLIRVLEKNLEKKGVKDHAVSELIRMIHSSVTRFRATIHDLSDIVKLQREITHEKEPVNLTEVYQDVYLNLKEQIEEANAEIVLDVEACEEIMFSRKNVKSIFYNLLSNALKYRAQERKLAIKISCTPEENYSLLSFQDNGLGISLKNNSKLFGMFQRLHTHVEGSGLGLYIVKKILDNAGGKIEVESQVGAGSTFKVYIKRLATHVS